MAFGNMFSAGSVTALGLPVLVLAAAISGVQGQGCSSEFVACGSTCSTFQEADPAEDCSTSCCSGLSCVANKGDGNTFCRPGEDGEEVVAVEPVLEEEEPVEPFFPAVPPPVTQAVPATPPPGVPSADEGADGVFEGQGEGTATATEVGELFEGAEPAAPPAVPAVPTTGSTVPPGPPAEPALPSPGTTVPPEPVDALAPPSIPTTPSPPPTVPATPTPTSPAFPTSPAGIPLVAEADTPIEPPTAPDAPVPPRIPTRPAPTTTPAGTEDAEPTPTTATPAFPVPGAPPEAPTVAPTAANTTASAPPTPFPTLGDVIDEDEEEEEEEEEEEVPAVPTVDGASPAANATAAGTPTAANSTAATNTTMAEEEEEPTLLADGTAPEPDEDALMELGYTIQEGVDYIPGPTKLTMVDDIGNGTLVETAEECAEQCDEEPACNIFAYLTTDFYNGFNCFIKTLDPGCEYPTDLDPLPGAWLAISETKCEVNATEIGPAAGPAAVMMGVYDQFLGKDYIPATAAMFNGTGPNLVDVVDIGEGLLVDDVEACEAACDAEPECNAASFYLEADEETMTNCFLKTLGESCMLPSDATDDDNAILSLKCDDAQGPAASPLSTDPLDDPVTGAAANATSRDFSAEGPDAAAGEVADDAARAPAAVFTGLAAIVAAGAAALM